MNMSKLTTIVTILVLLAILLIGYQAVFALMGSDKMGSDLVGINISPADFCGESVFSTISRVPSFWLQSLACFLVELPLFTWFLAIACFFVFNRSCQRGKALLVA
jgi:hypothetical protein